jgi:translation initiation factor 4E
MSTVAIEPRILDKEEKLDKLGDLVEHMDNVKITDSSSAELSPLAGPDKVVKHPLQNAWTLWFFKNEKGRSWEENQRSIITVTTVEDFWSLYNHIEVASKLPPGSDYSLFKEGIFPDWEDKR